MSGGGKASSSTPLNVESAGERVACLEEKCNYIECKRAAVFPSWSCAEKKKKVYECMRKVKTRNNLISFGAAKIDYIFGSSSKEKEEK